MESNDKLLTVKEVAEFLRVSERTVMRYIYSKKIVATKVGQWRVKMSDLQKVIKKNTNKK